MTAFNVNQLPTGVRAITSLEELIVWAGQALSVCNPKETFVRRAGDTSEKVAAWGDLPDNDGNYRLQIVAIPKIDQSKIGQSLPDWKLVSEISATPLPSAFSG